MPDRPSAMFSAPAHPTRRAVLAPLAPGATPGAGLAAPLAMSRPAVSKPLKVLERAGLIARGRAAQWRPCRLQAAPLKEVADWLEHYRRLWEPRRDRMEDDPHAPPAKGGKTGEKAGDKPKKSGRRR